MNLNSDLNEEIPNEIIGKSDELDINLKIPNVTAANSMHNSGRFNLLSPP